MRKKKPQLLKKQARLNFLTLAGYITIVAGIGVAWIMYSRAASDCSPASPCVLPDTAVATSDWTLTFSDEFDGANLDTTKWNTGRFTPTAVADEPFNGRREGAYFSSSNVSVGGGAAILKLTPSRQTINGATYKYASGTINTLNKYHMKPGQYIEARIRVPKCSGCWPAFWAIPSDRVPPEFDVFEFFNTAQRSRPTFNYHYDDGREIGVTPYGEARIDYRNDYHVYGMYWTGDTAVPFLDGKPYPIAYTGTTKLEEYIILNLSTFAGTSPAASQMNIDWIRVWGPPEPKQAAVVTMVPGASEPEPLPTPTPQPATGSASSGVPTQTAMQAALSDTTVVAGIFEVSVPDGAKQHTVLIDGTPSATGSRIDTRLLTNGQHIITVRSSDTGKKATVTTTTTINVNNRLNWAESTRNAFYAPFHGNITYMWVADLILFLLMVTGVGVARLIIRFRPRTHAVGLN